MTLLRVPERKLIVPSEEPLIILSPASINFGSAAVVRMATGNSNINNTWTTNKPLAYSFTMPYGFTVYQLGWYNGSAAARTDQVDLGIYDASWNRKVSTGATTVGTVSTNQWVNVADTNLPAGRYRLAASMSAATSGALRFYDCNTNTAIGASYMAGMFDSATSAHPLPDPLTNMALSTQFGVFPILFIALRATPV